jgi:hypothetical protein
MFPDESFDVIDLQPKRSKIKRAPLLFVKGARLLNE